MGKKQQKIYKNIITLISCELSKAGFRVTADVIFSVNEADKMWVSIDGKRRFSKAKNGIVTLEESNWNLIKPALKARAFLYSLVIPDEAQKRIKENLRKSIIINLIAQTQMLKKNVRELDEGMVKAFSELMYE